MANEMSAGRKISAWIRRTAWLILLLGAILMFSLLFVSYSACFFLALGFLLTWPARRLLRFVVNRMRTWRKQQWIGFLEIILLIILLALVGMFSSPLLMLPPPAVLPVLVEEYAVVIEPVDPDLSEFQVREQAILRLFEEKSSWSISPPARQITGTNRGLLLRELAIAPLQNASLGGVALRTDTCRNANVELRDFPIDSFYAARDAENLKRYPYIDTETITWSIRNLARGVVFSYIPPPFQYLRPILAPFIGATSLSQWIIGLLGFIGGIAVTPIVKPVLLDVAKRMFKSWVEKEPGKSPKGTATLIVSGKGQEEEIEIMEDKR